MDRKDNSSQSVSTSMSASPPLGSSQESSMMEPPLDGEYGLLLEGLEQEQELSPQVEQEMMMMKRTLSGTVVHVTDVESSYGRPLSVNEAADRMPYRVSGLEWHASIIPDDFFVDGKLRKGLNKRDFDTAEQKIKSRRPSLPVTASDFFSSLTKIDGPRGPRYIFYGILNGWPSLRCLELVSLEARREIATSLPSSAYSALEMSLPYSAYSALEMLSEQILRKKTLWSVEGEGARKGIEPRLAIAAGRHQVYRATLRGAPWSALGWSRDSPGFVFWYEAQHANGPRLVYGTDLLNVLSDDKCSMVHMISHRYAATRETPRDLLTYHSVCFLEWEHGQYGTVIETAYLNGIGGYRGRSNWFDDRDAPVSGLYRALPPELICPWRTTLSEIRCSDVPARNLAEFQDYINKYNGSDKRFVDPHCTFSHAARLTFRTRKHIAQYLINYILRDSSYGEIKRNCQTFTADLCSFLAGKRNVPPFHPVSRIDYQNRTHLFLYDSHMYESKSKKQQRRTKK